jgi:DNA-binding PadR family transcriptional regulator
MARQLTADDRVSSNLIATSSLTTGPASTIEFHVRPYVDTSIILTLSSRSVVRPCRQDVDAQLPLKPLVFQVLLALAGGERHGWALVREVQMRGGFEGVMPANFYRTLRTMLADGFIEETGDVRDRRHDDERRRYFRLTPLGSAVATAEARRLESLLVEARAKRLLPKSRS